MGMAVVIVALVGLGGQAIRGNRTVTQQQDEAAAHAAFLDNAFYRCLDVQARSLVSPGQPVTLDVRPGQPIKPDLAGLSVLVTMLKAVGSWITVASPPTKAVADLSLRQVASGDGACLGTVVVVHYAQPHNGVRIRVGSGAQVAGTGPPPAPPL